MTPEEEKAKSFIEALQKENEEILVYENEKAKWYTNSWTKSATEWAHKKCGLDETMVLIAIEKENGDKAFVVLEKKGNEMSPIYENPNYEALCYFLDALSISRGTRKK
jgi:hypothetical protein